MYPTVGDQLGQLRRILSEVVAPEVRDAYAAETLAAGLDNLAMLERAWEQVLPFLHWDNEALAELLRRLRPSLPADVAARLEATVGAPDAEPLLFGPLHQRNLRLRDLLAEVARLPLSEATTAAMTAYFRQRIDRYPFASTTSLPKGAR